MDEENKEALKDLILERIGAKPDEVKQIKLEIVWEPAKKSKQS